MLGIPSVAALAETFKVLGDVTRVRSSTRCRGRMLCVCESRARPARATPVFYTLDDQHIVRLFEQGMEHVEERR